MQRMTFFGFWMGIILLGGLFVANAQTTGQFANPQDGNNQTTSRSLSNTGSGAPSDSAQGIESNNLVDVGTLYRNIDEVQQNIDDIRFNNYEFSGYSSGDFSSPTHNRKADEKNIENLKTFTQDGDILATNIEVLKDRMGKSRNDLLPYLENIELSRGTLHKQVLDLEKKYQELEMVEESLNDARKDLDECYRTSAKPSDCTFTRNMYEDFREMFSKIYEEYRQEVEKTQLARENLEKQVIEFDQRLRAFRPPRIINADILPGPPVRATQENPRTGMQYISEQFIPALVNWLMVALMGVAVIVIITAGAIYIVGQEESHQQKAKEALLWTFIGVALAILSFVIVRIIIGLDIEIL